LSYPHRWDHDGNAFPLPDMKRNAFKHGVVAIIRERDVPKLDVTLKPIHVQAFVCVLLRDEFKKG